jgi:hypothetical protein
MYFYLHLQKNKNLGLFFENGFWTFINVQFTKMPNGSVKKRKKVTCD